jgi:putative flavoprotein involved in K+ transport
MTEAVDVLIIGGGQAGLAASYRLNQAGAEHLVVDASARIGDSWRSRYDSLTLFTPRSLSGLPGMALPGDADGYAGRDEFAEYLEAYAARFSLPVMKGTAIAALIRDGSHFTAQLANGTEIDARSVVVCTGAFQRPTIPALALGFSPEVKQFTTSSYSNPAGVPSGTVLVVGDGASGRDIAHDLTATHRVLLATGKRRRLFPERVLGRSTWTLMDRLGMLSASPKSIVGRAMRASDPFPDRNRSIRALTRKGVEIRPRLEQVGGRQVQFTDRSTAEIVAVVWAVGYRDDWDWVNIPLDSPGLHFLGRPWQRNRASALVLGAARDSEPVVEAVMAQLVRGA